MTIAALTTLGYTRLPVHGHYWPDLLPLYVLFAFGLAFAFIPVSIAAFMGVAPQQSGLASGLLNTSQQIGGAFGVAIASTIFISRAHSLEKSGHDFATSFTSGYHWAFAALTIVSFVAAFLAWVMLRGVEPAPEAAPAPAAAG